MPPTNTSDAANYITCPKGHKVFVIWSEQHQKFGFTCDECGTHSEVALSPKGAVRVQLIGGRV